MKLSELRPLLEHLRQMLRAGDAQGVLEALDKALAPKGKPRVAARQSKYPGVIWDATWNRWVARMNVAGERIVFGTSVDEGRAYQKLYEGLLERNLLGLLGDDPVRPPRPIRGHVEGQDRRREIF